MRNDSIYLDLDGELSIQTKNIPDELQREQFQGMFSRNDQ